MSLPPPALLPLRRLPPLPSTARQRRTAADSALAGDEALVLFFAIVAVELTDLIFAIDSIPAVLAITHDTDTSPAHRSGHSDLIT